MRTLLVAALLAAQVGPLAGAARAADLLAEAPQRETRMGAFAGARLRVSLGAGRERVRAGVAVAPSLHSVENGAPRLRVSEGLEYGFSERQPPSLSLAGRQLTDLQRTADGRRQNVSTIGWVAIGVGVVLVAGVGVLGWLVHEANENTE